jgi:hypothetical protein
MPLWLKRSLFLIVAGVTAWVEGYYLAPFGFGSVAVALAIIVILAIGWMRRYWKGSSRRLKCVGILYDAKKHPFRPILTPYTDCLKTANRLARRLSLRLTMRINF